jgi:hypothetical protein
MELLESKFPKNNEIDPKSLAGIEDAYIAARESAEAALRKAIDKTYGAGSKAAKDVIDSLIGH